MDQLYVADKDGNVKAVVDEAILETNQGEQQAIEQTKVESSNGGYYPERQSHVEVWNRTLKKSLPEKTLPSWNKQDVVLPSFPQTQGMAKIKIMCGMGFRRVGEQRRIKNAWKFNDMDGDGVPDVLDCQPFNRKRQGPENNLIDEEVEARQKEEEAKLTSFQKLQRFLKQNKEEERKSKLYNTLVRPDESKDEAYQRGQTRYAMEKKRRQEEESYRRGYESARVRANPVRSGFAAVVSGSQTLVSAGQPARRDVFGGLARASSKLNSFNGSPGRFLSEKLGGSKPTGSGYPNLGEKLSKTQSKFSLGILRTKPKKMKIPSMKKKRSGKKRKK